MLSPYLLTLFIDNLFDCLLETEMHTLFTNDIDMGILLITDDITFISTTVVELHKGLH